MKEIIKNQIRTLESAIDVLEQIEGTSELIDNIEEEIAHLQIQIINNSY